LKALHWSLFVKDSLPIVVVAATAVVSISLKQLSLRKDYFFGSTEVFTLRRKAINCDFGFSKVVYLILIVSKKLQLSSFLSFLPLSPPSLLSLCPFFLFLSILLLLSSFLLSQSFISLSLFSFFHFFTNKNTHFLYLSPSLPLSLFPSLPLSQITSTELLSSKCDW